MTSHGEDFARPIPVQVLEPSSASVPNAMTIVEDGRLIGVARLGQLSITQEEARETYHAIRASRPLTALSDT